MPTEKVVLLSDVSQADKDALGRILDNLAGTALEQSGDISIIVNGTRYVIGGQIGGHATAAVRRSGAVEIGKSGPRYRSEMVKAVAALGLAKAREQTVGREFTLKQLAAGEWDSLSDIKQRNAGKHFRGLLEPQFLRELEQWKTSDNEWHYRRR